MASSPRLRLLLPSLALLLLSVCCQVGAGKNGSRAPAASRARPRAEELVCCAPAPSAPDRPRVGRERCCGRGWGLHCCEAGLCCLDDAVVVVSDADQRSSLRGSFWSFKHWAQWLNLAVIIMVVLAMAGALLLCCWQRRDRDRESKNHLLDGRATSGTAGLYCYGAATGHHPSAPHWNPPMVSRWVDFTYKQPSLGTPLRPNPGPFYQSGPRVRVPSSDSESDVIVSPVFSSSDEEFKLVAQMKKKLKLPN